MSFKQYGPDAGGIVDVTTLLNQAISETAGNGQTLLIPPGTYSSQSQIKLVSGADILLTPGAVIRKDYAAGAGTTVGWWGQASYASKLSGVSIRGRGKLKGADLTKTGKVFSLYCDDLTLDDFTIDTFAGGDAIYGAGDRWRINRLKIINPNQVTGVGGIRYVGGDGFRARDCYVESGDDTLQFCPSAAAADPLYDLPITNGLYEGCTGKSYAARFLVAIFASQVGATNTTSITGCTFRKCSGTGGNQVIGCYNLTSPGALRDILFDDCVVTCPSGTSGPNQEIKIDSTGSPGVVDRIEFRKVRVLGTPITTPITVNGAHTTRVKFVDVEGVAPTGLSFMTIDNASDAILEDCHFSGGSGGASTVLVGGSGAPARVTVRGGLFDETYNSVSTSAAIRFNAVTQGKVLAAAFQEHSGQTTALALATAGGVTNTVVHGCDLSGMTNPNPITDNGTTTFRMMNPGMNGGASINEKLKAVTLVLRSPDTLTSAGTMALTSGNTYFVSGTTQINSITGGQASEEIVLIFLAGSCAVGNGIGNVILRSAFTSASAGAVLRLTYDGSNWNETGRDN